MAVATLCDGCHEVIEGAPARIGHVNTRDYCDTCEPIARDMISQLDELHDQIATTWESKQTEIKQQARTKLKAIPDEDTVD